MKRTLTLISLFVILVCCIAGVHSVYDRDMVTYDGSETNVVDLYNDPHSYVEDENTEGVAEVIVEENLEKTMAANNVAAVVFDFRGFDTLGEAFVLLTAIAGAYVVLASRKEENTKGDDE
jgi:hypothetical protein